MKLKSAPGTQCPMEGNPRMYIGNGEGVEVPDTIYYRRLVAEGSLIEIKDNTAAAADKKGGNK